MTIQLRRLFALGVVGALVLVGCGSDDGAATTAATEMGKMDGQVPAAGKADRVVEVRMMAERRFDPSTIAVQKGETITFKLVNEDDTFHEFMVGDEATHAARDKEMSEMGVEAMEMDDEANAVTLKGGETREFTWTFDEAGTVLYGCHQPGHFADGMRGTITVS